MSFAYDGVIFFIYFFFWNVCLISSCIRFFRFCWRLGLKLIALTEMAAPRCTRLHIMVGQCWWTFWWGRVSGEMSVKFISKHCQNYNTTMELSSMSMVINNMYLWPWQALQCVRILLSMPNCSRLAGKSDADLEGKRKHTINLFLDSNYRGPLEK